MTDVNLTGEAREAYMEAIAKKSVNLSQDERRAFMDALMRVSAQATEAKQNRAYSQRGDDYLIEAQRLCAEDKPKPPVVCPYCGSTAPKTVYVCSPFRATAVSEADREVEQRANTERALKACRILAMMGIQPLAPHLYFTRFLKDELAAERAAGMQFGLSWLEQADELWVFGDTVSEGMAQEIARAKELGKPVHILPEPGRVEEPLVKRLAQKLCAEAAMQRWNGSREEIAVEPKYKYWPVKISSIEVRY